MPDTTVQQVVEELAKQHLFTGVHPRPANPEVADAQKTTSNALAFAFLALHELNKANPKRALMLAEWWADEGGREDAIGNYGSSLVYDIVEDLEDAYQMEVAAEAAAQARAAKEAATA